MASRKIKLKDQLGRVVRVPVAAPPNPATAPASPPVVQQSDRQSPAATVWRLIREVPVNLQKLAKLVGSGFATRDSSGEWRQRSIMPGQGIGVANGDGGEGSPTISLNAELVDLSDVDGEAQTGDVLWWDGAIWTPKPVEWGVRNLDGGRASSIYGGTTAIDGGGA